MAQGREGDWRGGTVHETGNRRLVWTGRESMGPLVGDVPEYGTGFIGRAREGGGVRFGTYNIRNGWNVGLESALRGIWLSNMDARVFQETKVTDGIYTRVLARYRVVATSAPSRHRGSIALLYWDSPNFTVDAIRQFGANIIVCQLSTR